jgi:peptidoglycan/xylan/chitin deacetylase (PgdA/CDA1 family)
MYHSFDDTKEIYSIRPENFQAQLDAIKAAGFHPVTMKQIVAALDDGAPLPEHPIAITIDDARATQKVAIEMLKKEGFTATLFVPSGWHELSKEYIVELDHEGFDIESHTVWHANVALTPDKISEIREGQKTLEDWLGHPVLGFAYPYGAYRPRDVAELKKDGFAYALSIRNGAALRRNERYEWPRFLVTNEDPAHLISRLNNALKQAEAGKEPPAPSQFG